MVASAQKMHAGLFSGVNLEILLRGFQNNCNYQGRFMDLWKEKLFSVIDLWRRGSGQHNPPEVIGTYFKEQK